MTTEARLPMLAVIVRDDIPDDYDSGWFDSLAEGYMCCVVSNIKSVYELEESQSKVNFVVAHQIISATYQGKCVCIACSNNEVWLRNPNTGFVVASFNNKDYDYHRVTGCGICEECCQNEHFDNFNLEKKFEQFMDTEFIRYKKGVVS